jgi:peptidoglycan hydrolase-like protein with peptidoglycan-binding domain
MYQLRIGAFAIVASILLAAPFAFAHDDDDSKGKGNSGKGKKDDNASFVLPFSVTATTTAGLQEQIRNLEALLKSLKNQREALDDHDDDDSATSTKAQRDALKSQIKDAKGDLKDAKRELKFVRSLTRGMSGDDVRDLQELLAQDPTIFSLANITGFFGPLTEEAIRKFQRKHGIEAIGVFGPKTQAKILALFVGRELPPGIIARLGLAGASTTPGQGFVTICHKPAGAAQQTLVVAVPALGAHLGHGDSVGVCAGTTPTPTDTTRPVISAVSASSTSSTTAQVLWTTNENSSGRVWYGTASPLVLGGSTANVFNGAFSLSHVFNLSSLTASTTYFFVVESKDPANNTATSSQSSFTTGN